MQTTANIQSLHTPSRGSIDSKSPRGSEAGAADDSAGKFALLKAGGCGLGALRRMGWGMGYDVQELLNHCVMQDNIDVIALRCSQLFPHAGIQGSVIHRTAQQKKQSGKRVTYSASCGVTDTPYGPNAVGGTSVCDWLRSHRCRNTCG
jgi:hypothetical protein